jgi:hypothetical protein
VSSRKRPVLINEDYDDVLRALDSGANVCFVPTSVGLFQSIFQPATRGAALNAREDPVGFACTACRKTRKFAEDQGYEVL